MAYVVKIINVLQQFNEYQCEMYIKDYEDILPTVRIQKAYGLDQINDEFLEYEKQAALDYANSLLEVPSGDTV